ncbi:MAG: FecR family protein [Candidatus Kaiserbacteria bacterium]|nr:FecR family protein [Candidatus Kaiserbacteria bacterium]
MNFLSLKVRTPVAVFVTFLSLLVATSFGVSNIVNAQSLTGVAWCEKAGARKESCSGNTVVKLECYQSNCHAQYVEKREQCRKTWGPCPGACGDAARDCLDQSDKPPWERDLAHDQVCYKNSDSCGLLCRKASDQCFKEAADWYKEVKCIQYPQWKKSNEVVCGTGTQCVQNGDDAKCVRSSEQPVSPPAENAPSALPEATIPLVENVPEVEALVEKAPTNQDLHLPEPSKTEKAPENWGEATVVRMTGGADMQLADGSWRTVEVGMKIPLGAKLFSSYASETTLEFPNNLVILILALEELDISNPLELIRNSPRIKLGSGDVRFKVNQGDFHTDWQVSTPNSTASPTGTDFAVSYDKETGRAIWEIYDNSIEVRSDITGETKTISSSYGQPIKRIEVAKDGAMTEQIAIPKDEWQAREAEAASQSQPEDNHSNGLPLVFLLIVLGGGVFMLHKTGKLQPMLQKVSALARRDDSKPL